MFILTIIKHITVHYHTSSAITVAVALAVTAVRAGTAVIAADTPGLATMILLPFKGGLLCRLLFPLLCMALFTMLPLPSLIDSLSAITFLNAFVDCLHLSHEHHAHVCRHAIRGGVVLLKELDNRACNQCALLVFVRHIFWAERTSTRAEACAEGSVITSILHLLTNRMRERRQSGHNISICVPIIIFILCGVLK